MIVTNLNDCSRYETLHPEFKMLFDFIKSHNMLSLECGRIELCGDVLFINNVLSDGVAAEKQPLEVHQKYIDVHMLLQGEESIGWLPTAEIKEYSKEYDSESDCALTMQSAVSTVRLRPYDIVIVYPEDAHAPAIGEGKIRKIIAKVKITSVRRNLQFRRI